MKALSYNVFIMSIEWFTYQNEYHIAMQMWCKCVAESHFSVILFTFPCIVRPYKALQGVQLKH